MPSNIVKPLQWWDYNRDDPLSGDLIAYYPFWENMGSQVEDLANDNHGDLVNGTAWVITERGRALDFDGVNDLVRISPPSGGILDDISRMSIVMWVYGDAWSGNDQRFIDKGISDGWTLMPCDNDEDCSFRASTLMFRVNGDGADRGFWYTAANTLPAGQWNQIAVTYDRTDSANDPKLYVNGRSLVVSENLGNRLVPSSDVGEPISLGNVDTGGEPLDGKIDSVSIHNRILSDSEIQQLYDSPYRLITPRPTPVRVVEAEAPSVAQLFAALQPQGATPYEPLLEAVPYL